MQGRVVTFLLTPEPSPLGVVQDSTRVLYNLVAERNIQSVFLVLVSWARLFGSELPYKYLMAELFRLVSLSLPPFLPFPMSLTHLFSLVLDTPELYLNYLPSPPLSLPLFVLPFD